MFDLGLDLSFITLDVLLIILRFIASVVEFGSFIHLLEIIYEISVDHDSSMIFIKDWSFLDFGLFFSNYCSNDLLGLLMMTAIRIIFMSKIFSL